MPTPLSLTLLVELQAVAFGLLNISISSNRFLFYCDLVQSWASFSQSTRKMSVCLGELFQ